MGMLTILVGCNAPTFTVVAPADADGDGWPAAVDCDDADPAVHPRAEEVAEDGVDQDCDGADSLAARTWSGTTVDESFGSRVALVGRDAWVGAPFFAGADTITAGRLYVDDSAALEGADHALLGAGLAALADGRLVVGAPGAGEVRSGTGDLLLAFPGVGGVVAARGDTWVASTSTGAILPDTTRTEWDLRPDALALDAAGAVIGGFARGDIALRRGDTAVARASVADEAGYALLLADVDSDGAEELVVGAPGIGAVYVLDPAALPASLAGVTPFAVGTGRFGAALAWSGELYVGAPMDGTGAEGAVYAIRAGVPVSVATGAAPGAQLGFALAGSPEGVVAGAPGDAASPGTVQVVSP